MFIELEHTINLCYLYHCYEITFNCDIILEIFDSWSSFFLWYTSMGIMWDIFKLHIFILKWIICITYQSLIPFYESENVLIVPLYLDLKIGKIEGIYRRVPHSKMSFGVLCALLIQNRWPQDTIRYIYALKGGKIVG